MSRFLPDRLHIGIEPGHLTLVRLGGWRRRTVVAAEHIALPQEDAQTVALAALDRELRAERWKGTRLHLVVADTLARYFISPMPEGTRNPAELREAAALRCEEVFGEESRQWTVAIDLAPLASHLLGCMLRSNWLEEVKRISRDTRLPLAAITPFGISEFNRSERRIGTRSGWFAAQAGDALWLAYKAGNGWRSAQVHHGQIGIAEQLPLLLERDRLRADIEEGAGSRLWLSGRTALSHTCADLPGKALHRLGAPLWPGQDERWSRTFRMALSPVWPSCA